MMKIAFLDLDGTLRQTKSGETFINSPEDQQPITGAVEAVKYCKSIGYQCIGITNQGGVGAGNKSLQSVIKEQLITLDLFPELAYIYFCPDREGKQCWQVHRGSHPANQIDSTWADRYIGQFRKPNAGMIEAAILNYGIRQLLDLSDSFFTGDRTEDSEAAAMANLPFFDAADFRKNYVRLIESLNRQL